MQLWVKSGAVIPDERLNLALSLECYTGSQARKALILQVTVGDIAGIIAAVAFVSLVGLSAVPLIKLGKMLDALRIAIRDVGNETAPMIAELNHTVEATNTEISKLALVTEDVHTVTQHATQVGAKAQQITELVHDSVAGPLIRLTALQHGLKQAFLGRRGKKQ